MRLAFAVVICLALLACARPKDFESVPLIEYPCAFLDQASSEYGALPEGSKLATLITDYQKTRKAIRDTTGAKEQQCPSQ